jgi:diguanylate cyclase (GGDEF)-like protein
VESCGTLSQSVVNYVARTRRSIVIHNAQQAGDEIPGLDRDDYVLRNRVSSILCLPIVAATDSDSELIGMLYLENNRASHTFTEARFDTLEIIVMAAAGRLELSRKAAIDGLTHLYNREYFQSMLHQELVASQRHGRSLSLVLADIDHFKLFNDTWGHQLGDDVLESVADAVKSACREADIAARYGGEELAVILPDTDGPGAEVLAERVRSAVESLVLLHGKEQLRVTVSVGVALLTDSMSGEDDLLRAADEALYQAKHAGRNRVVRA